MTSRFTRLLTVMLWLFIAAPQAVRAEGFPYDPTLLSGHWYNPAHSGEGLTLDMISETRGILYWFTYDQAGNQVWLGGVGELDDGRLVVGEMLTTRGGLFGPGFDPDTVERIPWGSVSLTFDGCQSVLLEYDGPAGFGSGELQLRRLARNQSRPCPPARPFRMGFTPFPHDISQSAVDFAYDVIRDEADIVSHHFDNGVPWPHALAGGGPPTYDPAHLAEWQRRRDETPDGHDIFVSVTPIDIGRSALAPYRGATGDIPRASLGNGWGTESFDSERVKTAFLNYAVDAVEFFDPDYLLIGIEVNLLRANRPEAWAAYVELHRHTYTELKKRYPELPVFVSVTGNELLVSQVDPDRAFHHDAFRDVIGFSDLFGISFYPFMDTYVAMPVAGFEELFEFSDKPVAFTETAAPAEDVVLYDEYPLQIVQGSNPELQRRYFENLFRATRDMDLRFIINFVPRDYDALCQSLGGCGLLDALWRDTGFYDENGQPRPVLDVWRAHLARPLED